jgi:hypothetical protein
VTHGRTESRFKFKGTQQSETTVQGVSALQRYGIMDVLNTALIFKAMLGNCLVIICNIFVAIRLQIMLCLIVDAVFNLATAMVVSIQ